MMDNLYLFLILLGIIIMAPAIWVKSLTIKNGWICWFSKKFFDIHDYHVSKGGDGYPSHFYTYKCSKCGKEFII